MRISHKYKYMFFSKPKSASTTIRNLLNGYHDITDSEYIQIKTNSKPDNPFYSHITPYEAEVLFKERNWNLKNYSLFTTVRNPFTRIVSTYKHMTRKDMKWSEKNWSFEHFIQKLILEKKIENYKDSKWLYYSIHDHFYFIKGLDKDIKLKVFKVEEGMAPVLNYLKTLNIPLTSEIVVNQNQANYNGKNYRDFYTNESYEIVKKHYSKEIKLFNYTF